MKHAFDWHQFLREHRIDFVTHGKNVGAGEINISCPFCGAADPSEHMGLNPESGFWHCWRDDSHAGKSPVRLIRALLRCGWKRAFEIAGIEPEVSTVADLRARMAAGAPGDQPLRPVDWPGGSFPLDRDEDSRPFLRYLGRRGFDVPPSVFLTRGLRGSRFGRWAGRILFPIAMDGNLYGWTGRAISKRNEPKYLAYPAGEDSIGRRVLYGYGEAQRGGRALAIVEGPLDALKLNVYGNSVGVRALGLLGLNLTHEKIALLAKLRRRFDSASLILDSDAKKQRLAMLGRLAAFSVEGRSLPPGVDDPGELDPAEAEAFARSLCY